MGQERFWGSEVNVDVHEALTQQGVSCRATHRELAVADNGSVDILIEVQSSCHVQFDFAVTGTMHGSFVSVGSFEASAGNASLDVWNRNTFFQAANSGFQSTKVSHTASYGAVSNRGDFILGAGGNKQNPIGGQRDDSIILGPGLYAFQIQNKAGGAADLAFWMTWEEPAIPAAL